MLLLLLLLPLTHIILVLKAMPMDKEYLLVKLLQLCSRELQIGNCWQHHVPSAIVDVCYEAFYTVYCVERNLALGLHDRLVMVS